VEEEEEIEEEERGSRKLILTAVSVVVGQILR
jgi:hypothetical protein